MSNLSTDVMFKAPSDSKIGKNDTVNELKLRLDSEAWEDVE